MFGGTPTAAILGKDKKLRDRLNKEAENRANRKRLNKHAMETLLMNRDKKKKAKGKSKGPKLGGEFTGPRKNVLKRMNMGGVMKNRGGTFKGSF